MNAFALPISTEHFLPHRSKMRFVKTLHEYRPGYGRSIVNIAPDNLFLDDQQRLDPVLIVELFAQLTAALSGYTALIAGEREKEGFLVSVRELSLAGDLPAEPVTVTAEKLSTIAKVTFVRGVARQQDRPVAEGVISLWENDRTVILPESLTVAADSAGFQDRVERLQARGAVRGFLEKSIMGCMYNYRETGKQSFQSEAVFPPTFVGFDGHFPGFPLLPGVVQLKTLVTLAQYALKSELVLRRLEYAKFKAQCRPQDELSIQGVLSAQTENSWRLVGKTSIADKLCMRCDLLLQARSSEPQGGGL